MKQTIKVLRQIIEKGIIQRVIIECPNCRERVNIDRKFTHQKETYIIGSCDICGWNVLIADKDLDILQPTSPFWKMIYAFDPEIEAINDLKEKMVNEENRKGELEKKYELMTHQRRFKPWDAKVLKRIILEEE